MIKSILIFVFTSILFSAHLLIAQGDFSGSKCENSVKFLEDNCFTCDNEINARKCKVEEFKYLGEVNNHFYYSSIYLDYHPESGNDLDKEFNVRMIAIFEGTNKEKVKPVYSTGGGFGAVEHTYTELVSTKNYSIIHIGISDGNGGFDNGEFFVFKNNAWFRLSVPDLDGMFKNVIPKNCDFNSRGGWIDLNNLTFNRSVYKENEPACCPTAGKIITYLRLTSDNKIVVTKTKYFPDQN